MQSTLVTQKDVKWMKKCIHSSHMFSTCGKRQYFAVILDQHGHQIGSGWNGGPSGMGHCKDGHCPRLHANSSPGSVYDDCIAIHAEANALLHSDYLARRDGGTLYVNGSCCFSCAKLIANSGIKRVVCMDDNSYKAWPEVRTFMMNANINVLTVPESLLE